MTFDPASSRGINLPSSRSSDAGHREPLLCHHPDFTKNQYSMTLQRRQVRLHKNAKYPSCWQDPQVGPQTIDVSWTVYNYCCPEDVGFIKYLSENETYTTTAARIETDKSKAASTTPDNAR
ncbi:hypothetical protein VPH35_066116 [Triticum aestivum]